MTMQEKLDALTIPPLQWFPWWFQDNGYREYASPPEGDSYYHVSTEGWWLSMGDLQECGSIEEAKAAVEAERRRRLYAMFGIGD
jgi:hypothetical protein